MREIKFRFRYSDGKRFILKTFTLAEIMNGEPFEVLSNEPLLKQFKMVGQDQFIGLRDKNGVEIYEGDVVDNVFIEGDPFTKGEVIFDNGAFTLRLTYGRHEYLPCLYETDDREIEVIGNVWENGDLLNDSKQTKANKIY